MCINIKKSNSIFYTEKVKIPSVKRPTEILNQRNLLRAYTCYRPANVVQTLFGINILESNVIK